MTVFAMKKVLDAYAISETERCQCGCYKCVVHCPQCGSTQCYGSKRNNVEALLPGGLGKWLVRAFRCKMCQNLFSEVDCIIGCTARTRWRQKQEVEQRVQSAVEHQASGLAGEILEAARKYQRQKQATKELGPLEAAKLERENSHTDVADPSVVKLFETPKIDEEDV